MVDGVMVEQIMQDMVIMKNMRDMVNEDKDEQDKKKEKDRSSFHIASDTSTLYHQFLNLCMVLRLRSVWKSKLLMSVLRAQTYQVFKINKEISFNKIIDVFLLHHFLWDTLYLYCLS